MRYRAYLRDGTNVSVSGADEQEALDNAYEQYGEEPVKIVTEKSVMDEGMTAARVSAEQQERPVLSSVYPYSTQQPGSIKARLKDVFSIPGRAATAMIGRDLDQMKVTSEEHAKNNNPFLSYLTSPAAGATAAAAIPVAAVASPAATFAAPAIASIAAGYGFDEGDNYGLDDAGIELLASAIGATIPVIGNTIAQNAVVRALVERGIVNPSKELVEDVTRAIARSLNMKSAGKKVGTEYAGKIAKDARLSMSGAIPPKEEAVEQVRMGMRKGMTAQQAMANEQRLNSLYSKLEHIQDHSHPSAQNIGGYISPESLRNTINDLLVEYRDMPEAVEAIRKTFSATYRSPTSRVVEELVTGKPVPEAAKLPWEELAPGIAAGRAMEEGMQAPIISQGWLNYLPIIRSPLEQIGPRAAVQGSRALYPIPATLGSMYAVGEE